jgi:hypothetical protein
MYGAALEDGDYSDFEKYVNNNVAPDSDDTIYLGRDYSIDKFEALIEGSIEVNDADTIEEYASIIQTVQADEVEVYYTYKSEYTASATFSYQPDGWDAFSSINVYFNFTATDDGTYVLEQIYLS